MHRLAGQQGKYHKKHNNECRLRFDLAWQKNGDPKFLAVRHLVEPVDKSSSTPVPDLDAAIPEPLEIL